MFIEYPKALYDDRNIPDDYITVNDADEEAKARKAGYSDFGKSQEKPKRGRPRKVKDGDNNI